ncbi:hypothetical protein H8N03_22710 [Ramlibacter sp. USB13]|uniref:Uncharacterized protein n=1 Tax=Ramlibacter cellulosilyticus TaxID=2764187 RepID=A0A923SD96_9BURK|nr:hypothetical protein [Ramlibacter cellulosilyticus]MBC5785770.1 hypothetical protein [Ramlibacter cellulosilyticus]
MDFFNSLTLDMKMLVVGIVGAALLAVFSGNRAAEKRYLLVLAVLAAAGVYRFHKTTGEEQRAAMAAKPAPTNVVKAAPKHVPLVSTSAK